MDIKSKVQVQFGQSAKDYVASDLHRKGNDLSKLITMAELTGKEAALDVATGGGHTANALAPLVKAVTAFDLTKEMLDAAKQFITSNSHKNVTYVQGDAEKMPFPNEIFDVVTCRIAPHHFPNIDDFISEVHRVLKPDGRFILDDNVAPENNDWDVFYNTVEKRRDPSHFRAWKKSEWIQKIEFKGFEIKEWESFHKTFIFEPWFNRMKQSEEEKKKLSHFIQTSSPAIQKKFRIIINNKTLKSFQGEAIILKATKF